MQRLVRTADLLAAADALGGFRAFRLTPKPPRKAAAGK
jgi:hypothetical protein